MTVPVLSIPQWARRTGLADDDGSVDAARTLIAQGDGPQTITVERFARKIDGKWTRISDQGVRLADQRRWLKATPWAGFLAAEQEKEDQKKRSPRGAKARASNTLRRSVADRRQRRRDETLLWGASKGQTQSERPKRGGKGEASRSFEVAADVTAEAGH